MGIADRHIEYLDNGDKPTNSLNINSQVMVLIIINFTVFLFVKFLIFGVQTGDTSISPYFNEKLSTFLVPTNFLDFLHQPWCILTFAFFHSSYILLISNMLWLWCFGSILQNMVNPKIVIPIYIFGAFFGGFCFLISHLFMHHNQLWLCNANVAILAVVAASTTFNPKYKLLENIGHGVPLWVLSVICLVFNIFGMFTYGISNFIAIIGGLIIGYLFAINYVKGNDWSKWMIDFYDYCMHIFSPKKIKKPISLKEKILNNSENSHPFTEEFNQTQQKMDELLDKINTKGGVEFLTDEERNFLKKIGQK